MSLRFVELEFDRFSGFRQSPKDPRVVAAKFDCGCEWRLIGNDLMKVYCRIHRD
jgi:hypothetical protein